MAFNRFMHPRNPFKERKPDFKALATKYKAFRDHAVADLKGRVHIDFKKPECLRALSWALLKDEFQLDVDMPMDRLIPTIPLRMNYILWLEDLIGETSNTPTYGIDIGTGASCVYPLLGAKRNGWYFLATETDGLNYGFAKRNIEKNDLKDKIQVVKVNPKEILLEAIQLQSNPNQRYDFCMSNPPFFSCNLEAWGMTSTRSDDRPEPNSISTASPGECIFPGGEVEFVRAMISDSHQLKDQVRVYSTMLGKKSSLTILKEDLKRTGVPVYGTTEFCQGRTMRWGLAWSFDKNIKFTKLPRNINKPKKPFVYSVPKKMSHGQIEYSVQGVVNVVTCVLEELQMTFTQNANFSQKRSWLVKAQTNTWSNQRRKRRQQQRDTNLNCKYKNEDIDSKKSKLDIADRGMETNEVSLNLNRKEEDTTQENIINIQSEKFIDNSKIANVVEDKNANTEKSTESKNSDVTVTETVNQQESTSCCPQNTDSNIASSAQKGRKNIPTGNTHSDEDTRCNGESPGTNIASDKKERHGSTKNEVKQAPCERNQNKIEENIQTDCVEDKKAAAGTHIKKKSTLAPYVSLYILKFALTVHKHEEEIVLSLEWVDGEKFEMLHQVFQYIKNRLM